LLTGLAWPCFGQAEVLEANIQTVWRGDTLQIAAWATNLSEAREEDLHYQLLVTRLDGRGNRSTSRQGGSLGLMPNEQLLLARSLVNLPMPARAEVQLLITRPDGAVVASDELTIMAAPPSTTNTPLRQGEGPRSTDAEDIELSGIFILDNTRTRAGHDFYDLFYQAVGQPELSGSFQLVLEELPGMGISSTLQIFLNGQLQFENRLTPQYDYLQELATLAAQVMLSRMANYDQLQQDLELEGTGIY
jgi:curli production assembly/transport component CsgE